jgi:hypothetical protein
MVGPEGAWKSCSNLPDYPRRAARGTVPRLPRDMPHVHTSPRDQMSTPRQNLVRISIRNQYYGNLGKRREQNIFPM